MSRVRVAGFSISLDGFGAGIEQSLDDPLGKRGPEIFQWFFHTRTFCAMVGRKADLPMWTTRTEGGRWKTLAPSSLAATCLVRSVAHGRTTRERDGGVPIRHTMHRPSF